jgi:pilus assembly protein CpaC
VSYRRNESELLVVVTGRLARPLSPHEVPPMPTDYELNDPNDFELFLLGSEGRSPPPRGAEPDKRAMETQRGPSGQVGFIR